nr:hypothetical protein [Tanacetum cinerariifolium]
GVCAKPQGGRIQRNAPPRHRHRPARRPAGAAAAGAARAVHPPAGAHGPRFFQLQAGHAAAPHRAPHQRAGPARPAGLRCLSRAEPGGKPRAAERFADFGHQFLSRCQAFSNPGAGRAAGPAG